MFFALGIIVGLAAFKVSRAHLFDSYSPTYTSVRLHSRHFANKHPHSQETAAEQAEDSEHFLPVPGSDNGAATLASPLALALGVLAVGANALLAL